MNALTVSEHPVKMFRSYKVGVSKKQEKKQQMIDLDRQRFFWSRTIKEGDHLIWTGSFGPRDYGFMYMPNDTKVYAHRIAWCIGHQLDLEDIEDKIILRTCDRNDCVKLEHLVAKPKKLSGRRK